jgi:hypothetical protein
VILSDYFEYSVRTQIVPQDVVYESVISGSVGLVLS